MADEARNHSQAGHFDAAQHAYEAAYAKRPDAKLLFNLARVLHKAGRPAEAAVYYQRYLDAGAEGSDEQRIKAQQHLETARREQLLLATRVTKLQPPTLTPAKTPLVPVVAIGHPAPRRYRPLAFAKWSLLGTGAVLTAVGASLWGIDGSGTCSLQKPSIECPNIYRTVEAGISLTAVGVGSLIGAAIIFGAEARRKVESRAAMDVSQERD